MLVHIKQLFKNFKRGEYAYPAFNTMNLEITRAILAAAEELQTPVILETSEGAIKYAGLTTLYQIMATLAESVSVPVALHMDHGKDIAQLEQGIALGYSSVMIDHSLEEFEKNIADTKVLVSYAHQYGAWVQGEIGKIRGSEDWLNVNSEASTLVDPAQAEEYWQRTEVDTLACSFGTIHGIVKMNGKATPNVRIDLIADVAARVPVPLVLHGASGVAPEVIAKAIKAGISIINIDTELRIAYSGALRRAMNEAPSEVDPRKYNTVAMQAVTDTAKQKLLQCKTKMP